MDAIRVWRAKRIGSRSDPYSRITRRIPWNGLRKASRGKDADKPTAVMAAERIAAKRSNP